MKKIILIPDSFKGTMSSKEICSIMEECIRAHYPATEIVSIPVADGGEGTVDSFLTYMGGKKITVIVKDPYMKDMESFYGLINEGNTAIIEMAACAGLPIVGKYLHAEKTTTYGVGQLIVHAAQSGCKKIIVGLGGSATNDLGAGAAAAAGIRFIDKDGVEFVPVGENLSNIVDIDTSGMLPGLKDLKIITMCDIDNPLYGKTGAAYVFAPQKGADSMMVEYLDNQLKAASGVIKRKLGIDISELVGAGAAGGMGGGMVAFFGSKLEMGIEVVLDTVNFDSLLPGSDLVFSGEGKIDDQTLRGKVVIGVARRAKKYGVPLIAVVGDIGDNIESIYEEGVSAIFSINRVAVPFQDAKLRADSDMMLTMDNLMRFLKRIKH